jgi:predicted RNase H-like HicB family nuclease
MSPRTVAKLRPSVIVPIMQLDSLKLTLTAVFEPASEGGFTCHFEELPEVFSQGETMKEARANLADALQLVMEHHRDEARARASSAAIREPLKFSAS